MKQLSVHLNASLREMEFGTCSSSCAVGMEVGSEWAIGEIGASEGVCRSYESFSEEQWIWPQSLHESAQRPA